jgi:hypothetical protein
LIDNQASGRVGFGQFWMVVQAQRGANAKRASHMDWRVFSFEGKTAAGWLGRLLQGADTGGAKALGNSLGAFHDLHFLDIDVPAAAGRLARPRTIVSELRAAATTLTLRHDEAPLHHMLTAQLTHSKMDLWRASLVLW